MTDLKITGTVQLIYMKLHTKYLSIPMCRSHENCDEMFLLHLPKWKSSKVPANRKWMHVKFENHLHGTTHKYETPYQIYKHSYM